MRKIVGVGAALLLAGAFVAPASAAPATPATVAPVAVVATVPVEADPVAVVDFESPVVATVAAPEPEVVTVAPVAPVVAVAPATKPATVQPVNTGGTVTATETEPQTEPEVVAPEVVAPVATPEVPATEPEPEPVPTPEPTEEAPLVLEGDAYAYSEYDPAFWEYNLNPETGEPYEGSYIGTYWARSIDYFAGRTDVEIRLQPGVHRTVDGNPMSSEYLYVFHLWSKVAAK